MDPQERRSEPAGQDGVTQLPDPQAMFQQHLAHWQAAFQEYWKCMASQGAAMPQQWAAQAMIGGSYGGMPYFPGGMMNPYGGMMDSSTPMQPQGALPAATMAPVNQVPEAAPAPPVPAGTTATTGTSSQAGLNGNGLDSDADSRLTTDQDPADQLLDIVMAVSDTAAAAPVLPDDAAVQPSSLPTIPDAAAPAAAAAAAIAGTAALPASALGTLSDVAAGSTAPAPADSVPASAAGTAAAQVAPLASLVLPTSSLAASAATAPVRAAVGPVGLPLMGLAQPTALASVSQAAVQLSGMGDHAGTLSRHHSTALSLLMDDGQPLDEKDLKRLRRKQSNRESARRSRLRKQAENDTLQQRLHDCEAQRNGLIAENAALKQRLEQLTVLVAKLSQDKAALLTQVHGLGGQVPAELEATPLTTISTFAADTMQQQLAAAAAASQAVVVPQASVAIPVAAAVAAPIGANAAVPGLPDQLQHHPAQLQGIAMTSSQPVTLAAATAPTADVATAILASA